MQPNRIQINRAPVLTLWAAVVAERLGFERDEALSLGKAVAGLTAQIKGRNLGLFTPTPEHIRKERQEKRGEEFCIDLCNRAIPVIHTSGGVRALTKGAPIEPATVERYLRSKFGDSLDRIREAMQTLARSFTAQELAQTAFGLYEQFRPEIPEGVAGWGAKGELDLERVRSLGSQAA